MSSKYSVQLHGTSQHLTQGVCVGVVCSPCSGVLETRRAPCTLSQWKSLSKLSPVDSGLLIGFVLSSPSPKAGFEGTSKGRVLGNCVGEIYEL